MGKWITDRDPPEGVWVDITGTDILGSWVLEAQRVNYKPGSTKGQIKSGWRWKDRRGNVIKRGEVEGWRWLPSEPHTASPPTTSRQILDLLDRSDPEAIGELQRLAIGFRLATMETDCATVRERMRKFVEELPVKEAS